MVEQPSVVRASIIVAAAALLEAVLGPYLTFGYVSPKFALIGIVFAVSPLRDLQAVLLGLLRRHPARLFKQRALRGGGARGPRRRGALRQGERRSPQGHREGLLSQVVAVCVAAFGLLAWTARHLAGYGGPPLAEYAVAGILPDALLNAVLAYLVGGWLLKIVNVKSRVWESD
jgi:hypothetical protein